MDAVRRMQFVDPWRPFQERFLEASTRQLPDQPHPFVPRRYGSKEACWCGARLNDEIHTNRPKPSARPPRPTKWRR
jgi:hypothetical protein